MAELVEVLWPGSPGAPTARLQRAGVFAAFVPDPMSDRVIAVSDAVAGHAARVERMVAQLSAGEAGRRMAVLSALLLRSEAIASSFMEGLAASPQKVALAEFADMQPGAMPHKFDAPLVVARNVRMMQEAVQVLGAAEAIATDDVLSLHRTLLPGDRFHGLRSTQNWVGKTQWTPLDAEYVPPPPAYVEPLMDDLCRFASGATLAPLLQAALVHHQFETVHPFADGNGRVGRALVHAVLTRRRLTSAVVLPVSLALSGNRDAYVEALMAYRVVGEPGSEQVLAGLNAWLSFFLNACQDAVGFAIGFTAAVSALEAQWVQKLHEHRQRSGLRAAPREDSAVLRLLGALPEQPLLSGQSAADLLGVTARTAKPALDELAGAGILALRREYRVGSVYLASDLFELIDMYERG